jgi:beta-lactamase superfamily II metal-dependent hydrolase
VKRLATILATAATLAAGCATATKSSATAAAKTLDIYFVDVEGGQSALMRLPSGESILLDAGFPGDGTFNSKPGPPAQARDAQRILAAARDAGVTRIDYLILSHYHADHAGGVIELAQLLPIGTFVDHAAPTAEAETVVPGTIALYEQYVALRAKGTHITPRPGDRLPIPGLDAYVVAIDTAVLTKPLPGGGQPNAACTGGAIPPQEKTENPRSLAVLLQYGRFRFLDVGDLTGAPLQALTCPVNLLGEADAYLVAHHGGADGSHPALFAALKPLVAITANGTRKGAQGPTLETIRRTGFTDGWQLHATANPGAQNVPDERIANLDQSTTAWIKLSARSDGSFTVTNGRTGSTKSYHR